MTDRSERILALLRERGPQTQRAITDAVATWWPGESRRVRLALEALVQAREVRVVPTPQGRMYEVPPDPALEHASPEFVAAIFGVKR